ncbi:Inactive hydroxysteroid dehydrogenase-like protein 1 [Armadillidium nasatum]|uniref:Inactive hydroxysteroid dehydrogenase-like protein 1 n=1 Tax=Armadillidium nasatum TaxID=96803 RepID=A0A5N5T0S9_9CRUS|nr:Inactive hydroxysteroid dehydrogenase-like protein 1 [Armadillidium nasatum]
MAVSVDSFSLVINELLPALRRLEEILAIVGLFYIGKVGLNTLWDLGFGFRSHIYSRLWRKKFVQRFGKWAVVTGCTDGIGRCYAEELAKEGLNIVLISRNIDKLKRVAAELGSKYKIETEIVQVDFSDGLPIYSKIEKHLQDKEIGMLINNVGVMLPYPKYFTTVTESELWSHINVNMASVCAMTKLILPQMVNRGKGAIVNIASIAGAGAIPLMGIYAASKAFVDRFSQALEYEYGSKGITVQTVNPSYVATNMTSYSPWIGTANFITPPPSVFVKHAVSTIGYAKRTTGYWVHGIQAWFVEKVFSNWFFTFNMAQAQYFFLKDVKKSHDS